MNHRATSRTSPRQHLLGTLLSALLIGSSLSAQAAPANPKAKATKHSAHHASAKHGKAKKPAPRDAAPTPYGERADLMQYAHDLAATQVWDETPLRQLLAQAKQLPAVQRLIMPPPAGTAKDWGAYRARFVEPKRIQAGLAFWEQNAQALQRAQDQYGVPPAIVVGLIGVETFYGQITGGFKVLDALVTLAFDFPTGRRDRSAFFRDELAAYLQLCREQGLDAAELRGSYAGAMGWPQFMPSSWRRHAVDFDGDGHIDLIQSPVDAIGSVAHYLAEYGWQRELTTHYSVAVPVDTQARATLLAPDVKPSFSVKQFTELGAQLSPAALDHSGPLALIELQMGEAAPQYWAGTQNFYALTRYNWSAYYAMGVIELGRAIEAQRSAAQKP